MAWRRSRIGLGIAAGMVLVFMLSAWVVYRDDAPRRVSTETNPASTAAVGSVTSKCQGEIEYSVDAEDAVVRGDAYLNGVNGYNLSCARLAYEHAISLNPTGSAFAWHQLGRTHFLSGNYESAIEKFEMQQKYFGDTLPNVHYMLGLTYGYRARKTNNAEDWVRAEEAFKTYVALDTRSPWARTDLAWVYFAQGKFEEMKEPVEQGLIENPTHPWLLNMYGLALMNTDDTEGAHAYFKAALTSARTLTPVDWGRAYPGNDPSTWDKALRDMVALIEKNMQLTAPPQEEVPS